MRLALVIQAVKRPFADCPDITVGADGRFTLPEHAKERCSGYSCGCACPDCLDLAKQINERGFSSDGKVKPPSVGRVKFPWEMMAA